MAELNFDPKELPVQPKPLSFDPSELPVKPDPTTEAGKADFPLTAIERQEQGFLPLTPPVPDHLVQEDPNQAVIQAPVEHAGIRWTDPDKIEQMKRATTNEEYFQAHFDQNPFPNFRRAYPNKPDAWFENVMAMSENSEQLFGKKLSPVFVADNYDALNKWADPTSQMNAVQFAFRIPMLPAEGLGKITEANFPGTGKYVTAASALLGTGIVGGVRAAGGLALFHAQGEAADILLSYQQDRPHALLQTAGLADLAQTDADDKTKLALDLLDVYVKGLGAHVGLNGIGAAWREAAYDTVSGVVPAQKMYIPAEVVAANFESGADFTRFLGQVGWTRDQIQQAAKYGLDLEIPLQNVVAVMDSPIFQKLKQAFRVSPYVEITSSTMQGESTAKLHTSGELEAPKPGAPEQAAPKSLPGMPAASPAETSPGGTGVPSSTPEVPQKSPTAQGGESLSKGFTGEIPAKIADAATKIGMDPNTANAIVAVESGFNPAIKNPRSSAQGLFQFIDSTWKGMGGTPEDRGDVDKQIERGVQFLYQNTQALTKSLGRAPQPWELYIAHQQGAGGASGLLTQSDKKAADIVGEDAVVLNGGTPDMTAGQFTQMWKQRFETKLAQVTGGEIPAAASTPGISRQQFVDALSANTTIPAEQKDAFLALVDARANAWAKTEGKLPEEWYQQTFAGIIPDAIESKFDSPLNTFSQEQIDVLQESAKARAKLESQGQQRIPFEGVRTGSVSVAEPSSGLGGGGEGQPAGPVQLQNYPEGIRITEVKDGEETYKYGVIASTDDFKNLIKFHIGQEKFKKRPLAWTNKEKSEIYIATQDQDGTWHPSEYLFDSKISPSDKGKIIAWLDTSRPDRNASVFRGEPNRFLSSATLRQTKKGATQFLEDSKVILHLFETADVSTLLHEFGHILLPQVPAEDLPEINKWVGNAPDTPVERWTRKQHEKWARGFELYCAEGVAPSAKLRSIFQFAHTYFVRVGPHTIFNVLLNESRLGRGGHEVLEKGFV